MDQLQVMKEAGRKFSSLTSENHDAEPPAEMSRVRQIRNGDPVLQGSGWACEPEPER